MKLAELKKLLRDNAEAIVRFLLPNGDAIPIHAHATEIARIDKNFIDCGGTFRKDSVCRIQTWVATDTDHRLQAGKLAGILDKAHSILNTEDIEVDIEYEMQFVSQFPLKDIKVVDDEMFLELGTRHTACLATQVCCPSGPTELVSFSKL